MFLRQWIKETNKELYYFTLQLFRFLLSLWGKKKSRKFHRPCETSRAVWDRKREEDGKIFLHRRKWRDTEGCGFESNAHFSIWGLHVGFLHILFFVLLLLESLTLGCAKHKTGNRSRSGEEQTAVLELDRILSRNKKSLDDFKTELK